MITVGLYSFQTKAAVEKHIRSIFQHSTPMQPLAGEDLAFVLALIERHPRKHLIIDCGIRDVVVQEIEKGFRRFLVRRTDSSIRDFSWRKCLDEPNHGRDLRSVLRNLIQPQVDEARRAAFSGSLALECPINGERITAASCHIDHAAPDTFASLVDRWIQSSGLNEEDIELNYQSGYQQYTQLADPFLAQHWIEFHREFARLRAVSQKANLSDLRRAS
jgi:hypothetical protein